MRKLWFYRFLAFIIAATPNQTTASDDFPALTELASKQSDESFKFSAFKVLFDVYEVKNGDLLKIDKKCSEIFPNRNYLSNFITERLFNGIDVKCKHCKIFSFFGSDVVDFFDFAHCPFFPTNSDISAIKVATKDEFTRVLGIPRYSDEDFSYIGFFNIRGSETRFCWFFLEHSSKRLFVGLSKEPHGIIKIDMNSQKESGVRRHE